MRLLLALALALALLAGGALVLAPSGEPAARAAVARPAATPAAALPPLPAMRPRAVEPAVAGAAVAAGASADSGRAPADPAPAAPASATRVSAARDEAAAGDGDHATATALPNGIALPPLDAPRAVKRIIAAGNVIARTPYKWGGGHGRWRDDGYDCSGSVSFALHFAGLLDGPRTSGGLMDWGEAGPGRWVTVYAHEGHVFLEVAGIRFDTSGARRTGSRWQAQPRGAGGGFVARHPPGL
jgi:cell wall-associated NlpC family hydrolase